MSDTRKGTILFYFILFYFILFYVFILRETVCVSTGRGREKERKNPSRLHAESIGLTRGSSVMNHEMTTWAEINIWVLTWLTQPGAPRIIFLTSNLVYIPK